MTDERTENEGRFSASAARLRNEFDRWLETMFSQGEKALDAFRFREGDSWWPSLDVVELPEEIVVVADVPGMEPEAIDVSLAGNMLKISGIRTRESVGTGELTSHRTERLNGTFARSVPMPCAVDPDQLSAEARNGVLTIRLGKSQKEKPQKIQVNVGGGQPAGQGF